MLLRSQNRYPKSAARQSRADSESVRQNRADSANARQKSMTQPGRCYRFLWVGYVLFLLILSGCKSFEIMLGHIHALERAVGGDKVLHLLLAIPLGLLFFLGTEHYFRRRWLHILLGWWVLCGGLIMEELSQFWLATRRFDWLDSLYGFAGILVATLLYLIVLVVKYQRFSRNDQSG